MSVPQGPLRRFLRKFIHFFSYHLFLTRKGGRVVKAGGFQLHVRPTVFHPRIFLTSEFFAHFISGLDLHGMQVVDVGTGTGILALAAARAGAVKVVALDINPAAVEAAQENARINGVGDRVTAMECWDGFGSPIAASPAPTIWRGCARPADATSLGRRSRS